MLLYAPFTSIVQVPIILIAVRNGAQLQLYLGGYGGSDDGAAAKYVLP